MHRRIDEVLGNLRDFPVGARTLERIGVGSDAMTRRLLRLPSSIGDLGVTLADDVRLQDGDVLVADAALVIAVAVQPDEVLVLHPASIAQALEVGHALGNRHVPMIADGDAVVIAYADALESLFLRMGVRYERTARVLERPFVHAHAPHVH